MTDSYLKQNCRLCDSKNIGIVLPLEKSPLCDAYLNQPKKQNRLGPGPKHTYF